MPEVWAEVTVEGKKLEVFLNSGASDVELAIPSKVAVVSSS